MHKALVVVFEANNARILINPANLKELQQLPNVVVNPNLEQVKGMPPHCWKLQNGKVVPLDEGEREQRYQHIHRHGAATSHPTVIERHHPFKWWLAPLYTALGAGLATLVAHLISRGVI
jgi:hypothetical protein